MRTIDSFRGDYEFLSNFSPSPMFFEFPQFPGRRWIMHTVEHAFQSAKVNACPWSDEDKIAWLDRLSEDPDPKRAKYLGRSIEIDVSTWNNMGEAAMRWALYYKFTLNPNLRRLLLNTGDAILIEGNTWGDRIWGQVNGEGQNLLGKSLMELRERLRSA